LFTARNLRATQDKLDIDRQGQLTNRFIQATGQLGAELKGGQPNIEVRLGGIYALNRISNDWPKDYWPIADVLTAYVRHNARWSPSAVEAHESAPTTDIQAILTVLGRDDPPGGFNERHKLDLRNTDLRGAEFWDAHLEWTDFWGAHLDGAKLWGAILRNVKLENAHLTGANLRAAKLEGASLQGADVTGAVFDRDTVWPTGFDARGRGAVFIE
jgi:Pentapeptide repeats (8 copies)